MNPLYLWHLGLGLFKQVQSSVELERSEVELERWIGKGAVDGIGSRFGNDLGVEEDGGGV